MKLINLFLLSLARLVYINGIQLTKFGLLIICNTPESEIKDLTFCIVFVFGVFA
jgi:hypothetical protein